MKPAPSAVLDTNVVLSALLFAKGRLTPLRLAWQTEVFRPMVSKATVEELMRAVTYPKFKLDAADRQELFADYIPYCTVVQMPAELPKTPHCRDPCDVPFLQLAIVAGADFLVTGDKQLLRLAIPPCRIVTAQEFLGVLGDPS